MIEISSQPIKHYCIGIYDGPHATPREADDGPIFLGIKNITDDGRIDLSEIRHVSEEEFPKWTRRVIPQQGDVVLTYEATLHRYALIPAEFRGCLGRRVALVRPDPTKADSRFLLYYFLSSGWRRVVESSIINGATVDRLPLEKLPTFPVRFPQLKTQRKIADILSAYDELVTNNQRRIELLEQSARHVFKEWFVRLRYPGHEHDKIVDRVPEGWERTTLGSLTTKIGSGATPRGGESSYKTSGITLIRSQNVYDYRFEEAGLAFVDDNQAEQLDNVEVHAGDVLLNITGASVGRCCLVPTWCLPARVNQHVMIIRAKKECVSPYYLLCTLNSDNRKRYLLSVSSGGVSREAQKILFPVWNLLSPRNRYWTNS
jgi:type I restriction enzyme, S subunit